MTRRSHAVVPRFTVMLRAGGASSSHRCLLDPRFRGEDDLLPGLDRSVTAEARSCLSR